MGNKKATNASQARGKTAAKGGANSKTNANTAARGAEGKRTFTEKFLFIFGIIALVSIIASIIVGVVVTSRANYRIDFLNDDLSKFIYLAESDYKNFEEDIKVDPVDDYDVENAILQALCAHKAKKPEYEGVTIKNQTITPGDLVYIYYRGYTLDENGKKVDFDGGCNFSGAHSELEIGSGSFVPGFELNLVGKNSKDYGTFTKYNSTGIIKETDRIYVIYTRTLNDNTTTAKEYKHINLANGKEMLDGEYGVGFFNGIVGKQYGQDLEFKVDTDNGTETINCAVYRVASTGDLIQFTYSSMNFDGTFSQNKSVLIDLSDPDLDAKWGEGFADFFKLGLPVGIKAVNNKGVAATLNTIVGEGEKNSYFDMTVNYVYKTTGTPLTVEAHFPEDYQNSEELQGVTAMFDVYIQGSVIYEAPEYNEAFITDTLKLTAEDLEEYEGEGLLEKYEAKLKAELEEKYKESYNKALDNAIWAQYVEKAVVKRLPEKDVLDFYDSYYKDIETQYSYYSSYYQSFDAFAREYLSLSSNADWRAELRKTAEKTLTQKLAFYYVMRREGLVISDEEFEARYDDAVEEYFVSYLKNVNCTRDKYDSDEEYEKDKAKHKETMLQYYTKDYFRENITYEYALETLRTYVIPKE